MAVQPSTSHTVPLYVLIIFIVLFLASATGLVLLFVQQDQMRVAKEQAEDDFDNYIGRRAKSRLNEYKGKGPRGKSAADMLLAERDQMAQLLTGSSADMGENMAERVEQMLKALPDEPAEVAELKEHGAANLIGALTAAGSTLGTLVQQLEAKQQKVDDLNARINDLTQKFDELTKDFSERTRKFQDDLVNLTSQSEAVKKQYEQQLADITGKISEELRGTLKTMEKSFSDDIDDLQAMVRRNLQQLIGSMKELGTSQLRVASKMTVEKLIQRNDGQVLELGANVVYISLGDELGVRPGMRFAVYSSMDRGSIDPQVKAIIEVTETEKLTSAARIVQVASGNPILENDLILNLVYDRELKLNFFVLGDFDLNGDGRPDRNGYERVVAIVASSGGTASAQLSPAVNFVVLGTEPKLSAKPAEDAGEKEQLDYQKQLARYRGYSDLKDQIEAMAVPKISPSIFLKFTGHTAKLN